MNNENCPHRDQKKGICIECGLEVMAYWEWNQPKKIHYYASSHWPVFYKKFSFYTNPQLNECENYALREILNRFKTTYGYEKMCLKRSYRVGFILMGTKLLKLSV